MIETQAPLLEIDRLVVEYRSGRKRFRAVEDVTFQIGRGETVGLVGESGSGKTTIGRAVLGLAPITEGAVRFAGEPLSRASRAERRTLGRRLQAVFQDPFGSMNPSKTIGYTLAEPVLLHEGVTRQQARDRVVAMLERVGMRADAAQRYPAQFSGGQRQRIAIARALMSSPDLVICDEPVSALDLSIQAEVVNLLRDLQESLGVSYLFISHDLTIVRHLSDRLVVLQRGKVVEAGDTDRVYEHPQHPYTRGLLAAAPVPDPTIQRARRAARAIA